MKDFIFIKKSEPTKKAVLRVDIIEDGSENFTIMYQEGVENTEFENLFPWKCGEVFSMTQMNNFAVQYQSILDGYVYGGEQVKVLGSPTHKLKVTAAVTGDTSVVVILKGIKQGALDIRDVISLDSGVLKELVGIEGYEYSWELSSGSSWTDSEPDSFICSKDETISLSVTVD